MGFIDRIFGDANEKYLKKLQPVVERINSLETEFQKLSDEKLKSKTIEFRERLKKGESLDDLLPEAFALAREAAKRTLNQRHFDVQLIGGIVLYQGKIAEMKTGEGKTLAATLPLYLNALTEKGCHLITVNDYLAKRDTVWMGQIYHFLGLSTGCIAHEQSYIYDPAYQSANQELDKERDELGGFKVVESYLRPCSRKEAYSADITYGTNNEFAFDYLRDNMAYDLEQQAQRGFTLLEVNESKEKSEKNRPLTGFNYAIIDEVDSILIDEARTPLIISMPETALMSEKQWQEERQGYYQIARLAEQLKKERDYLIDEKRKTFEWAKEGQEKFVKLLGEDPWSEEDFDSKNYLRKIDNAVRAKEFFLLDKDYVIRSGEVVIVDEFTGRLMPGRRWSGGLHQAVEAKEYIRGKGAEVRPESKTLASITFQNYFRMYQKLAGMTGTAATSAEEFDKVYKLEVIVAPTNKPMIRKDLPDRVYMALKGKFQAVVKEIKARHQKGQPVLVGTTSIEKNEYLGKLLEKEGIPHQVLNAKYHEKEGQIIAQAGSLGQVTIATNMAGRGVDIVLGGNPSDFEEAEKVKELGGLHVIGTERHEARRIDNQLRGRTGRQGDHGSSQFFLSLEDDLMRIFASDRIKSLMATLKMPEDQPIEAKLLSGAIESAQGKIEGMNFDLRKHILDYDDVMNKHREVIYKKRREILEKSKIQNPNDKNSLKSYILEIIKKAGFKEEDYLKKEKEIGEEKMRQVEKVVALKVLDMFWLEHLENMDYLRDSVRLRAYGQRDPLVEYKSEGHRMFKDLLGRIEISIANAILRVGLAEEPRQPQPVKTSEFKKRAGRNDPCPCGKKDPATGRPIKYKKCCMPKYG